MSVKIKRQEVFIHEQFFGVLCSVLSTSLSSWKMHDITIGTDVDLIYLDSIVCVMPHSAT